MIVTDQCRSAAQQRDGVKCPRERLQSVIDLTFLRREGVRGERDVQVAVGIYGCDMMITTLQFPPVRPMWSFHRKTWQLSVWLPQRSRFLANSADSWFRFEIK